MGKAILIILLILLIWLAFYIRKALTKFQIGKPVFVDADLKSVFSGNGFTNVDISETITNGNNFSVPVSNLYAQIFYNGNVMGKSTTAQPSFVVPSNGSITITQNITLVLTNSLEIGLKVLNKETVNFNYKITALLFGWYPLVYNGSFMYP